MEGIMERVDERLDGIERHLKTQNGRVAELYQAKIDHEIMHAQSYARQEQRKQDWRIITGVASAIAGAAGAIAVEVIRYVRP